MAEELDYVPMPAKVVDDIEKMWSAEIKDASGKPLSRDRTERSRRKGADRRPFLVTAGRRLVLRRQAA